MADAAFDRMVINPRERPLSSDINELQSEAARTAREMIRALMLPHNVDPQVVNSSFTPVSGFHGDGFYVTAGGALTHTIKAGLGFIFDAGSTATDIGSVSKLDDRSPYYPVYLSADQPISSPAAPGVGQERVDIIEVALDRRLADSGSRDVLDTGSGVFTPTLVMKTLAYSLDGRTGVVTSPSNSTTGIGLKAGASQAAGTYAASNGVTGVPTATPGYTIIAVILVTNTGAVVQGDVRDTRFLLAPDGVHRWGFDLLQVPGSPNDTFTIANYPPASAGFRFGCHQTASPSNGGTIRCYVFGGRINTQSGSVVTAMNKAGTVANANRLVRMSGVTGGSVTSAIKAALVGGGTTNLAVAIGQEYISWEMDATRLIDVGDPSDANRIFHVIGLSSPR